jgi:hypothetical protein
MLKRLILIAALLCVPLPASAQIALNALASAQSATDQSTAYTLTASTTITANRVALFAIYARAATATALADPTIAGTLTATWEEVAQITVDSDGCSSGSCSVIWVYRTMVGSNQTGSVTVTPGGGQTWVRFSGSLAEFSGVDVSGTNGSGAIVQSATHENTGGGGVTTCSVTLNAFGAAGNRPYFAMGTRVGTGTDDFLPETDYDQIHEVLVTAETDEIFTSWRDDATDTTPSATWSTSDPDVGCIGVELKLAVAVTGATSGMGMMGVGK